MAADDLNDRMVLGCRLRELSDRLLDPLTPPPPPDQLHALALSLAPVDPDPSPARYRELFDFNVAPQVVTGRDGLILKANYAAADLLRTPREFLVGKPLPFFLAPDSRKPFFRTLTLLNLSKSDAAGEWEVQVQPRRSAPVCCALAVTPVSDDAGHPVGWRWQFRDRTAELLTEQALGVEKKFTESLLDVAQVVVLVLDARGRVQRSNPYARRLAGFEERELHQVTWFHLLPEGEQAGLRQKFQQALILGNPLRAVSRLLPRHGAPRVIAWTGRALDDEPGNGERRLLVVGYDMTELQEAQQKALAAERLAALGQMTAGLAHESRNALQRTLACLERLSWRLQDRPEALDLVARARAAQADLIRLFEDVRLYAGHLNLKPERCHVATAWREAWAQVVSVHPGRAASLVEETAGVDLWCDGDGFRLQQVFRNVFENSFAACPGPVRVVVAGESVYQGERHALRLSVRDNGPGLSAEQQARIFEPFFTTKLHGSGLGMAIARRILEGHGGTIAAGTAPGGGAEIVILLPRERS